MYELQNIGFIEITKLTNNQSKIFYYGNNELEGMLLSIYIIYKYFNQLGDVGKMGYNEVVPLQICDECLNQIKSNKNHNCQKLVCEGEPVYYMGKLDSNNSYQTDITVKKFTDFQLINQLGALFIHNKKDAFKKVSYNIYFNYIILISKLIIVL